MEELERVLERHARRYPKMEPTDAVKLIYQNEFGGGHLIPDEARAQAFLRREYAGVVHDPSSVRSESIGNGLCRVHLAALEPEEVELLGKRFCRSAEGIRGTVERFEQKLECLRRMTRAGYFGFGEEQLEAYLAQYRKVGYPPVSHSEAYRRAYHPAYRIVKE